jgi:2',3'-cyclic-nucleotide 2'-phosphodiesterase (5'-nucleotidase family)
VWLPSVAAAQSTARLTILHTNDTHGHLLPFSYPAVAPDGSVVASLKERRDIGGVARRAALARQVRADLLLQGVPVWLVDAGDFSDGTAFSTEYRGEADVAAMNAAGYDFATIGNHEFNYPLEHTRRLLTLTNYPLLVANVIDRLTGKPIARESLVVPLGPVRIGLFGLVTHEASTYPAVKEGLTVLDEAATARRMVADLRTRADIVILLSHCGDDVDERLAAEVPGIDVIVGGHTHSRLPFGTFVWGSEDLRETGTNGTIIVQAFQWGGELGRLDLLFRKSPSGWAVDRYRTRLLPLTPSLAGAADVEAVVSRYWTPIAERYGEVIGQAADDFSSRGDDEAPYNLVADAIRETFGAEFDMENDGGIRAPLVAGPVTRGDLITMDPFDNTIVLFKASGRQIRDILTRQAPHVSGLRYRLSNGVLSDVTINGQPLDDERIYAGATNSYFAGFALRDLAKEDSGKKRLDVVIDYVRKKGTITPVYDGRRAIVRAPRR